MPGQGGDSAGTGGSAVGGGRGWKPELSMARLLRSRSRERCQFEGAPYRYPWPYSWARPLKHAFTMWLRHGQRPVGQGRPAGYQVGDWVRVKDADAVRATLDADDRLRGLWFAVNQWGHCGRTYQVERVVRRMLTDSLWARPVSATVALAGATCDSPDGSPGCGRACSLYFREEWLEPASGPGEPARPVTGEGGTGLAIGSQDQAAHGARHGRATVRTPGEIRATLDRHGRRDGVVFSENMWAYCGQAHQVARPLEHLTPLPAWKRPAGEWFILDGVRCDGSPLGGAGACDRNCALFWHRDWLVLEEA